ncbi:MAG: filamentous hemagglutinin N-terminal domain-containing protein, partial [Methylococcaceae bacterium]|nr:filamentous hemagglutinin N-terminal domain-containing protein [Methylococcaceae bacterium]
MISRNSACDKAAKSDGPAPLAVRKKTLTASIQRVLAAGLSLGMSHAMAGELPIPKAALVSMGRADQVVNGNKMVINQYTDRTVLNWEKFNIGRENTVQFKQPSAVSVALNRIGQSDPSQILGNLTANGQVYLLNPNGFVFGKDSTVNVNTLVATNLNITDDTFERGITKVFNQDGRAALTGTGQVFRTDAEGNKIKIGIEFEKGAKVSTDKAGRLIAAAPSIMNRGEISTPDGQILMVAATDKVYLQETSGDSSLRGLVVEVATGGDVTNVGKMVAARGNVTLAGFAVNQEGQVSASTAVQANGSVRLLAREGAVARRDGDKWLLQASSTTRRSAQDDGLGTQAKVTLATGSVTEATPDLKDKATAVDGQTQEASRVEIMGKQVRIENNATLRSHSGKVSITATENPSNPTLPNIKNDSKVVIAKGARIDVSGIKNVSLAMERNVVEVELRSNELRDAPVQKNGPLYAKKVKVDIRKGTPIADITGALDRIARSVAERSTSGGSLAIASEGDAILAEGARIDLSGGSVRYRSGYVNTSILIGPDGRSAVDIGQADPNVRWVGLMEPFTRIYTGSNLSVSSKIIGPAQGGKYESGYVEGKSAGTLDIRAAALALDAEMQAAAINGSRQRLPELQAAGGQLSIDLARTPGNNQDVRFGKATDAAADPDKGIATHPDNPNQPLALTVDGTRLRKTGLQSISVNTHGKISVDAGHTVELVEAGALTLRGGDVAIAGNIKSLAGKVDLETQVIGGSGSTGAITLESGSVIDTRGGWNNDRPAVSTGVTRFDGHPLRIDGGTVAVKAEGDVNVEAGSRIDVSGGAHRQLDRKIKAGDAGSISLEAAAIGGSDLSMQGTLLGHAVVGGRGGSLSMISDQVQLGFNDTPPAEGAPVPLFLDDQFFTQGGFAHYTLGSNKSGVQVSDSADIKVRVDNRILGPDAVGKATGADLREFSQVSLLPEQSRPGGELTLQLAQKVGFGGKDAAIRIGEGAAITTDARGKINLKSDGSIVVNGTLTAQGGEVDMNIATPAQTDPGFLPNQGIWLGSGSNLDVSGTSLTYQDALGRMTGDILAGGKISLHADRGFIITDLGASMNVSGTAGLLDLPASTANQSRITQRQLIASDAGHIELQAAEGMQLFGFMKADGGGPGAAGGDLQVELNPFTRNEPEQVSGLPFPRVPSVIAISQNTGVDQQAPDQGANVPVSQYGQAVISAEQVSSGGFSSVTFRTLDRIDLLGDVTLSAQHSIALDAPVLAFKPLGDAETPQVLITAPHVALGSTQTRPGKHAPSGGPGNLQVAAGLIDLTGTMALQGFGSANLTSSGDLRLTGVRTNQQQRDFLGAFLTAGDLALGANQIYPSTLTDFRIAVEGNPTGTLTVAPGNGTGSTPLSAGGRLTLEAPNIVQGGTLKAPIGEINLKASNTLELAAGSITSNSAQGSVIPFGRGQGGLDWIYPLGQQNLIYTAPPEKKLSLEGAVIDVASGAVIDTAGGGDLLAYEHVPGPGGSYDVLDPASPGYQGSYAIIPGYRSSAAPIDFLELPDSGLKVGDSLYLSGGGGLEAGHYVLMPAHYALLPGAYLVTPKAGTQDRLPGFKQKDANGAQIVSGYRTVAGTTIREPRWTGWSVEKGSALSKRAEYAKYQANDFYTGKAKEQEALVPYLPQDAGAIRLSAGSGLNLDGLINATPADKGRGGRLDIAADAISVVAESQVAQAATGSVRLFSERLNSLNVASISLGGIRSYGPDGVTVDVKANTVELGQGAQLEGQEFILAAKKDVTLAQGSSIATLGSEADSQGEKPVYLLNRDSAFVRVSSGPQANLKRAEAEGRSGNITLAAGSSIASSGSIMLDAAADNTLSGTLTSEGGSVSLGAKRISLGEVDFSASGLILDQTRLSALQADELILNSGSDISLYGATAVSARQLTLRSAGLLGFNNAGREASLQADAITIDNASGVITSRIGSGNGNLTLSSKTLTLG